MKNVGEMDNMDSRDLNYIIDRVERKISEWWVRSDHGNRKENCVHFVMDEIMKETKGFVNPQILEYYTKLGVDNFMGQYMKTLERLTEWVNGERGRSVEIYKPSAYGVHDGEIKLGNVDKDPKEGGVETEFNSWIDNACVFGVDQTNVMNSKYTNAENFVCSEEDDLEQLINIAIDKAIELGL